MSVIELSWWQLLLAVGLVILLSLLAHLARLGISRSLLLAALSTVVQLALIGLVLEVLFAVSSLVWVGLMALVMLLLAGREVTARQRRRLTGGWTYGISAFSMLISSFALAIVTLALLIGPDPWYTPQYAITLGAGLGTLLAVTMASRRLFDARQRLRLDRLRLMQD